MITFFTTTKNFTGKTKIAQINAIKSWKLSVDNAEVIIFGESEGTQELSKSLGFIHKASVKVSKQGTPLINDMFEQANTLSKHKICCFINADIIVYKSFAENLIKIHQLLEKKYLIVGQRQDVTLTREIDFDSDWETTLDDLVSKDGSVHPPGGSDFFAFPKDQYKSGDIPDLLVGRGGWDLWMIYNGRLKGFKVIDLSKTSLVVHQNHDYSHRQEKFIGYTQDEEALANLSHLPEGETYNYTLAACNYYFANDKLYLNFARGDLKKFINYELSLKNNRVSRGIQKFLIRLKLL